MLLFTELLVVWGNMVAVIYNMFGNCGFSFAVIYREFGSVGLTVAVIYGTFGSVGLTFAVVYNTCGQSEVNLCCYLQHIWYWGG